MPYDDDHRAECVATDAKLHQGNIKKLQAHHQRWTTQGKSHIYMLYHTCCLLLMMMHHFGICV